MDEYKTEKAVYTAEDFILWQQNGVFEITPKFQRRKVWRTPAKSYFIDTILRDMTVPPLYFRKTQSEQTKKMVRQVVDGQQRVRSVLDFIGGEYRLSGTIRRISAISEKPRVNKRKRWSAKSSMGSRE